MARLIVEMGSKAILDLATVIKETLGAVDQTSGANVAAAPDIVHDLRMRRGFALEVSVSSHRASARCQAPCKG